jgi:hypothetical protein
MPNQDPDLFMKWKNLVEDWEKSNSSMAQWCRERSLPYHQFIYWKERILPPTPVKFIELQDPKPMSTGISILIQGVTLQVEKSFDENTLLRLIHTLEKNLC